MERTMADAVDQFFEGLASRGHEPLLDTMTGTVRFDIVDGRKVEHWRVAVKKGVLDVSHDDQSADSVLRTSRECFKSLVSGRMNATAAVLRGELQPEGDIGLLLSFQRVLPGPPQAGGPS
jgi:putative sterol carrier protein